jgi:exopolysaccharide biosynthesis protein
MNLDGGGSTELWLRGKIVNQPCYGYERNTATGLVLLKRGNQANTATRD